MEERRGEKGERRRGGRDEDEEEEEEIQEHITHTHTHTHTHTQTHTHTHTHTRTHTHTHTHSCIECSDSTLFGCTRRQHVWNGSGWQQGAARRWVLLQAAPRETTPLIRERLPPTPGGEKARR